MPGSGRLTVTGQLGDVMRESAQAAVSFVRARQDTLGLDLADDYFGTPRHPHPRARRRRPEGRTLRRRDDDDGAGLGALRAPGEARTSR